MKIEHIKGAKRFFTKYTTLDYIPNDRTVYTIHWFDGIRMNPDFDDPLEEFDSLEAAQNTAIKILTENLTVFHEPGEYLDSRIVYHKNVCVLQLYMDRAHHDKTYDEDYFNECGIDAGWVDAEAYVISELKYAALE